MSTETGKSKTSMIPRFGHIFLVVGLTFITSSLPANGTMSELQNGGYMVFYGREGISLEDTSRDDSSSDEDADFQTRSSEMNESEEQNSSKDRTPVEPGQCEDTQPTQCDPTYPYRTIDGTCNNLNFPTWGSANQCYLRFQPAFYEGYGDVRKSTNGSSLPEPRDLSLDIFTDIHRPTRRLSFMFTIYGQTVAHDLSQAPLIDINDDCCFPGNMTAPACLPTLVKPNDPFYSQFNITCIQFHRTQPCNVCNSTTRQQINAETTVLDASILYGSDEETANKIRAKDGSGKLLANYTNQGELLPTGKDPADIFCPAKEESKCFFAGDSRVNQHATLTSLQTLFMREHNRLAIILKKINPNWGEERLYQESRKINIAELQCITYKEYLPYLLGPYLMEQFGLSVTPGENASHYDPKVRLGVWNEFAVAAFRLHSMVAKKVGALQLRFKNLFSNPGIIRQGHMKQLMKGVCKVPSEKYDHWYIKDVTDYLYQQPDVPYGMDLSVLDIQRGRDHGLAPYIYLVKFCSEGNIDIASFDDLSPLLMPQENVKLLKENYATIQDVDLWVGLQMEHHLPDSEVGPTAACIIAKQFYFQKFGDRFYFEHEGDVSSFTAVQRENLKQCSLSRLLCDNSNISYVQRNSMLLPSAQNPKLSCEEIPEIDLTPWKEDSSM